MTTLGLNTLPPVHGRRHRRVGRGHGSGRGTYAGKGIKGQRARTGGRTGIVRRSLKHIIGRLPKQRGFLPRHPAYTALNLSVLQRLFHDGDTVSPTTLAVHGIAVHGRGLKILGSGKLEKKLTVNAHAFSRTAERGITAAGGRCVRLAAEP
ncbi:MAG: 50S ribosomal protein L15 [Candidatus Kerfeldbacteria bacterium]|nr:50S ribosomal protein L15 [Candidatus Kerfeldbacteria bacterium]